MSPLTSVQHVSSLYAEFWSSSVVSRAVLMTACVRWPVCCTRSKVPSTPTAEIRWRQTLITCCGRWWTSWMQSEWNSPHLYRNYYYCTWSLSWSVCICAQFDAVCLSVWENCAEESAEGAVEDCDEQSWEDHHPSSGQWHLCKTCITARDPHTFSRQSCLNQAIL